MEIGGALFRARSDVRRGLEYGGAEGVRRDMRPKDTRDHFAPDSIYPRSSVLFEYYVVDGLELRERGSRLQNLQPYAMKDNFQPFSLASVFIWRITRPLDSFA